MLMYGQAWLQTPEVSIWLTSDKLSYKGLVVDWVRCLVATPDTGVQASSEFVQKATPSYTWAAGHLGCGVQGG